MYKYPVIQGTQDSSIWLVIIANFINKERNKFYISCIAENHLWDRVILTDWTAAISLYVLMSIIQSVYKMGTCGFFLNINQYAQDTVSYQLFKAMNGIALTHDIYVNIPIF